MNEHILSTYDDELREMRAVVIKMAALASEQLSDAMHALTEQNIEAAAKVRASKKELDNLENTAERAVIGVFARRAPVADDLREVISALKITTMVVRIGDCSKNIARRSVDIADEKLVVMPSVLQEMAECAQQMIQSVMDAYLHRSANEAHDVWQRDDKLDTLYDQAYQSIQDRMRDRPDHINSLTHYLMIAKNLERIGDQTTNIAEQIYYAITGKKLADAS